MNDDNPYSPPKSELSELTAPGLERLELANRRDRFVAAFVDGMVYFFTAPVALYPGLLPIPHTSGHIVRDFPIMVTIFVILNIVLHIPFLLLNGQTIGKKLVGIKMIRSDGTKLSLGRWLALRTLPVWALMFIPQFGWPLLIIDQLTIFRADLKCLHDLAADTIVVKIIKS